MRNFSFAINHNAHPSWVSDQFEHLYVGARLRKEENVANQPDLVPDPSVWNVTYMNCPEELKGAVMFAPVAALHPVNLNMRLALAIKARFTLLGVARWH